MTPHGDDSAILVLNNDEGIDQSVDVDRGEYPAALMGGQAICLLPPKDVGPDSSDHNQDDLPEQGVSRVSS